jgi:hypothetical protein
MYPSPNHRAIGWALLSQSIWLPLLVIDANDHWQERISDLTPPTEPDKRPIPGPAPIPTTRLAAVSPLPTLQQRSLSDRQILNGSSRNQTGLLLNGGASGLRLPEPGAILRNLQQAVSAPLQRTVAAPIQSMLSMARPSHWLPPVSASLEPFRGRSQPAAPTSERWQGPPIPTGDADILRRTFTRSELLGGTLSLRDIDAEPMSTVALAERARWANSADPMAALPPTWRDPMRKALGQIPGSGSRLERARFVHVPSRRVNRATEIPLALQSDGSVDILSRPDNPLAVRDIEEWSSMQRPPGQGGVQPAVVMLHPVSESAALGGPIEGIPLPMVSESNHGIPVPLLSESKAGPRSMESHRGGEPVRAASLRRDVVSSTVSTRSSRADEHQSAAPTWETVAPAEAIPFQAAGDPEPGAAPAAEPAPAPEPVTSFVPSAPAAQTLAAEPQPAPAPAPTPVPAP